MLKQLLFVGLGGSVGSILRYLSSHYMNKYYATIFPIGTFFVNMLGCFLIGLFASAISLHFSENNDLKLLLITGFCGGYTTFSAFAIENYNLANNNQLIIMCLYTGLSIVLGILAVWLGIIAADAIITK